MPESHADDDGARPFGREAELAWLHDAAATVERDGARVLVLAGEGGIGKTRLVESFLARCPPGVRTGVAGCSPYGFDPLLPLRRLLDGLAPTGSAGPDLDPGLLDATGPAAGTVDDGEARAQRAQLFVRASAALLQGVGTDPAVLVVDDLHWGQPTFQEFVAFFVDEVLTRRVHHRLLVVLITRILPPPDPIVALLGRLERRPEVERLDLDGLARPAVEAIVASTPWYRSAGGRLSSAVVDLVERSAHGNPLLVRAAVDVLAGRGIEPAIGPADIRTWREIRFLADLGDPLTTWIGQLPAPTVEVLAAAVVWGEEFTAADLGPLVDLEPAELRRHVGAAVSLGLLGTDGHLHWFGHAAFREVVLRLAPPGLAEEVHSRCAQRLMTSGEGEGAVPGPAALRIGHHLLAAGDLAPDRSVEALVRAGRVALRSWAWIEAARYLEAARRLGSGADPGRRAELLVTLGHAYYFDHDFETALPVLAEAIEVAAVGGEHRHWGEALIPWLRILMVTRNESLRRVPPGDAARLFLAAPTDADQRSLVLQALAEQHITAGDTVTGADLAHQAQREAERAGDRTALAFARYAGAFAAHIELRVAAALAGVESSRREAVASGDWWVQDIMQARLALCLLTAGEGERADQAATLAVADAERHQEHSNQAIGWFVRAAVALLRGDLEHFDRLAERAGVETGRSGYVQAGLWLASAVALRRVYQGDLDGLGQVVSEWPDLPASGRRALAALPALLGLAGPVDLRPPRQLTLFSAGYYAARIEAALGQASADPTWRDGMEEASLTLAQWTAEGFEHPITYPTSLSRLRAEVALSLGRAAEARPLFREAVRRADESGAQLELARSLAGTARLVQRHGEALGIDRAEGDEAATRGMALAALIGLDARLLGFEPTGPPASPAPLSAAGAGSSEVTVLVTDIVGSTTVSRELGDLAYFELVTRHNELVRATLRRWSGHEFSESGDGLLAWFTTADAAIRAALEIQSRVAAERSAQLRIKVSLAVGSTLMRSGRPYGLLPALACRLLDQAGPNQIVVDGSLGPVLPPGLTLVEPRPVDLRGIGRRTLGVLASR